jgi:hypothetical protein
MVADCSPELILPMEMRAFGILKEAMVGTGFDIAECEVKEFSVLISRTGKPRRNRYLSCFRATSPNGRPLVVMKLPQHPVWLLEADYGSRCGQAIRSAAQQLAAGQPVNVSVA